MIAFTILALVLTTIPNVSYALSPCKIIIFEYGNVCECTEDYCDVIEPLGSIPKGHAAIYESTSEKHDTHRLTKLSNLQFQQRSNPNITIVYQVNTKRTYQTIIGYGGAFTDASGIVVHQLTEKLQQILLAQYFSKDGLQYNLGRIPMAGCDFSTYTYSYDSTPDDYELKDFSISMDFPTKIPFIQAAMNMSAERIYFFGSPWNGPDWLKNTSSRIGALKGMAGDRYHKTWARYFSKFIEAYESQGIPIWGITTQNEYSQVNDFNGLFYTTDQLADFIRIDLGPELRKNHPSVKIMTYDDDMVLLFSKIDQMIKRNVSISQYIDGIAVHWYATLDMTFPDFYELFLTRLEYPQFFYLPTEACEGYMKINQGPRLGMWKRGIHYALSIIGDLLVGASGWTDWNLVLNLQGGPNHIQNYVDSPIIANSTSGKVFYKNPMFYAMGHFSKFIPRDSKRIEISLPSKTNKQVSLHAQQSLKVTSFLTPNNQVVIVVLNHDPLRTEILQINDSDHGYLTLNILPESIQTIVYDH